MSKFICPGMYVINKRKNKGGMVITVDRKNKIAVIRNHNHFWSEETKNLEVASYEEVE